MKEFLTIAFLVIALGIILLVLLQPGKGGGMGGSLGGGGASGTLFGSSGAGNFLTRSTVVFATLFFVICLLLANIGGRVSDGENGRWSDLSTTLPAQSSIPDQDSSIGVSGQEQSAVTPEMNDTPPQ